MVSELVMDQRIVWNRSRLKEIDEAKKIIMKYKRLGHEILKADGAIMDRFNPALEEVLIKTKIIAKHIMKILTDKGDERLVWDKDNGPEAKQAKKKFLELLKKGYKAFSVDARSEKNKRIKEFDIDAEEILMVPQTVRG